MKSIMGIVLATIFCSGIFVLTAESSWAMNFSYDGPILEAKLKRKLEEGLSEWIRYLYPAELKDYLRIGTEVTLVPGRLEYALRPRTEPYKIWTRYNVMSGQHHSMTLGHGIRYELDVSADFVRLFTTEDALFAYCGILAQSKKIFQGNLKDLLNESLVTKMAEFMVLSGKNPYGYIQFIEHLYAFLHAGKDINPKDLAAARALLDRLTGANEQQKCSLQPLSTKLLMKSYVEKTMEALAEKLGVVTQFRSFKVDLAENDALELSFLGSSDRKTLSLNFPKQWSETFANEDQLVALIVYALLWHQEASKKDCLWAPDSIEKLDRTVVDTLLALDIKKPLDFVLARGYNPKEYYNLLARIERNKKKFIGLFEKIEQALKASQINPNTRITALQSYLTRLEIKHAEAFAETYPIQVFAKNSKATKSFRPTKSFKLGSSKPLIEREPAAKTRFSAKPKKTLNRESSKPVIPLEPEIRTLPSTMSYEEFTSYLTCNQDDPQLDLTAHSLVKLLPASELTFSVLTRFLQEEKTKYQIIDTHKQRLPITFLALLNTYLSRLEDTSSKHWGYWNAVYELVQDGIVWQAKHSIPSPICEDWENNVLKLLTIQIEETDLSLEKERAKLTSNLKNFSKPLGPCLNDLSKERIFKFLRSSTKVDLRLMIEWDEENSYKHKYKSVLKRKAFDEPNFLESTIFLSKDGEPSILARQAIGKLRPEILRMDALLKLSPNSTHDSYLRALTRRAGKIFYDPTNLWKLHTFVSRHKEYVSALREQDWMRMTLATLRLGKEPPSNILLPSKQNRLETEKIVDALVEGNFPRVHSLSLLVKMEHSHDAIKRYLDQKPLRSFDELLEFQKKLAQPEYGSLFQNKNLQYLIFNRISEQLPDREYSLANMMLLEQAVKKSQVHGAIAGFHPLFFKALKVLKDPSELAQVHRIWLESMVDTNKHEATWVMEHGSSKDYLKAVLAALEADDESLILEYPALSSTEQARDGVFELLMKSDLSNEFIQKWIESVFADKTSSREQKKKEQFFARLREQRPACSLKDVAKFLNEVDYETKTVEKRSSQMWKDCKHLLKTVPASEFTAEKVLDFSSAVKNVSSLQAIATLAVNGWFLKYTPKEKQAQLVQIFEAIRDAHKIYARVNQSFSNQMDSHFRKMIRAAAKKDPALLWDSFTPASFPLEKGGKSSAKLDWEQEIYRIALEEGIDAKKLLSLLVHRRQASLIVAFFLEHYAAFDQKSENPSQLAALANILSTINDANLSDQIASLLIFTMPKQEITWERISLILAAVVNPHLHDQIAFFLIFSMPKQEITWEQISSFVSSCKNASNAPIYAMLRLLDLTDDLHTLADIHSFLTTYAAVHSVSLSAPAACDVLVSNFDRMVRGSFAHRPAFVEVKAFTPLQMGCHADLKRSARKSMEQKYQFHILKRAAETGAIDREEILLALKDSQTYNSRRKFEKAIEQVKKMSPISSFKDLETLLISTEARHRGFSLQRPIFNQVIDLFPASEFTREKVQPVLKYLDADDQHKILSRVAKVSRADEDMDFVVREAGGEILSSERRFHKAMLGSLREDPENLFKFPIWTYGISEWGKTVLHKDWYPDTFIHNQLIEYWLSSDAPKAYLLAWLRFLPPELGKRDRALEHFIEKAGIRTLAEWTKLSKKAYEIIETKKEEESWLKAKENVIATLWNELTLSRLFKSLPLSELNSQQIVKFVQASSKTRLDIDQTYALNWALLKASAIKDYLAIHTELIAIKDVAPPAFCKLSLYMTKYMTMIKAVMDHHPSEALNFYEGPLRESFLSKYWAEDQVKRKRYAALDSLAEHLLLNNKHWPPGMAWVWIRKYIPVLSQTSNEGLEALLFKPVRLRADPTEAIIEIAARRGIMSFKDIPTEIESAKAIDPNFVIELPTQKAILERLPRESFTFENLKSYADIDAVWTKQTYGESILATEASDHEPKEKKTLFELQLEQRKDRPELLKAYLKTKKIIKENPILTYNLENSEKMQKLFIDKMQEGGAWPKKNLKQQHAILFSLAKRGPSELTDELLYQLYMNPSFTYASRIKETIENHAFWDLHRRKEIYEKYVWLIGKAYDEPSFKGDKETYAAEIVTIVNLFFPIPSMERSEILERLANDIKANEHLTQLIEDEKGRGVKEEDALGLGLYLMNKVLNLYPKDEERMALVKYFVRNDELPEPIAQRFRQQVGVNRLRRQFLELPPYGKALAINALIVNLLPKATHRRELEGLIWSNVQDENRSMAKLFYRSFVKALQETAPFQESIFVAFLLGQLANVQGSHPGEKLKYILESLGGTGISIGQKIYQRRMIPDEYLEHLKNMTDHSPLPSRKAIYDRLKSLLGVNKIRKLLSVQEILGGASTALVVRVLFKDGTDAALKMTFEDLPKRTQVEFRKMEAALNYLVEAGGSTYNRLRPVIQEVHDGLRGQEDLTEERTKTERMRSLYETSNTSKVAFKVVQTLAKVGAKDIQFNRISPEHVFLELAKGKTLTRLSDDQKKAIFPEIFKKEMAILLGNPAEDGLIYFEKDRHMGNFIVDFSTMPVQISVFDYPLLSSITPKERNALFQLVGWLEARKIYGTNFFTQEIIDGKIANLLATHLAEAPLSASKVQKLLSTALADKAETSEKLFSVFAIIDDVGTKEKIRVRPSLISYAVALGHAERYSQFVASPHEEGAFREALRPYVLRSDPEFKRMIPTDNDSIILETTHESFEPLSEYK